MIHIPHAEYYRQLNALNQKVSLILNPLSELTKYRTESSIAKSRLLE